MPSFNNASYSRRTETVLIIWHLGRGNFADDYQMARRKELRRCCNVNSLALQPITEPAFEHKKLFRASATAPPDSIQKMTKANPALSGLGAGVTIKLAVMMMFNPRKKETSREEQTNSTSAAEALQ